LAWRGNDLYADRKRLQRQRTATTSNPMNEIGWV
jgi:hypothetical protein